MNRVPRSNVRYIDLRSAELHNAPDSLQDPLDVVVTDDVDRIAVADLAAVFGAVAEQCVPDFCDQCVVDVTDAGGRRRVVRPAEPQGIPAAADAPAREHTFEVRFSLPGEGSTAQGADAAPCTGTATFLWYYRVPDARDRFVLTTLIGDAAHTLAWQRSAHRLRAAQAKVRHLEVALRTSREIGTALGILMSVHHLSQVQAFEVLRAVSQRSNRKVRELALEVIETGRLDPALLP